MSEKIKLLMEAEIISLVPESEFFNSIDPKRKFSVLD
jgi:hypothetical protein